MPLMPRGRRMAALLAAAALGPSAALLVACGDDGGDLIPVQDAEEISQLLDQAAGDVAGEECRRAQATIRRAQQRADQLPPSVDADVRGRVEDGMDHVLTRVRTDCGQQTTPTNTAPTESKPAPEPEPEPTTTQEEPPSTSTQPEPAPTTPSPNPSPGTGGTPPGGGGGGNDGGGSGGTGDDDG